MGLIESFLQALFPPAAEPIGSLGASFGRTRVVRGRVVPRDLIESPLTARRCVYYRFLVEELRSATVNFRGAGGLWHATDFDEAIAEFYLDDGTGRAVVEPLAAQVTHDAGVERVEMPEGRRASELRIEAGDWVEVQGVVDEISDLLDGDRGYRERATRVALRAGDGGRLRIRLLKNCR